MTDSKGDQFNEDYYMRGVQTGVSNYENYRWLGEPTILLARNLVKLLNMSQRSKVLDFGCAKGHLVKAMRLLGIEAFGVDVSRWAIANCDPDVENFVGLNEPVGQDFFDFIIAKDVLEHIPAEELPFTLRALLRLTKDSMFIIVPLARCDGGTFVCPKDEADATHVNRWTLDRWMRFLSYLDDAFIVSGSYFVPGLKPNASEFQNSCGFITLKRYQPCPPPPSV